MRPLSQEQCDAARPSQKQNDAASVVSSATNNVKALGAASVSPSMRSTVSVPIINKYKDDQTLDNGTRVITHTTEIKQDHEYGGTTVTNKNTRKIEEIEVEERIIGEDCGLFECFCCCLLPFIKKKKKQEGNEEDKSKWHPVKEKDDDTKWNKKKKEEGDVKAKKDDAKQIEARDKLRSELDMLMAAKKS